MRNPIEELARVTISSRPKTWRASPLTISYLMLNEEVSGHRLAEIYRWAIEEGYQNPRVISPFVSEWSSVFNPNFYHAVSRSNFASAGKANVANTISSGLLPTEQKKVRFWLQSVMFLSAVTMSAAIVQSRWSAGTIASKYDKLWIAGHLAERGMVPEILDLDLKSRVNDLANNGNLLDVDRLLIIRATFELVIARLGHAIQAKPTLMHPAHLTTIQAGRFGFLKDLRRSISGLKAVVAYGSSVTSESFADYDLLLISDTPELALREIAGTSPSWGGKELNVGIYSPNEVWNMQVLSGDNLGDFGICLMGEVNVPSKPVEDLLLRNLSFGLVRQRQQLGMIAHALQSNKSCEPEDRTNLYEYFVKIPSNIVKGTFGAVGTRLSKEYVQSWMLRECNFNTADYQFEARNGNPGVALAASAVATENALKLLNKKFNILDSVAAA